MREKKEINLRIGANMKAVREEFGYTQEELSEVLNVTPQHLSAVERGVFGASLELVEKLCRLLNVSADRLLFGIREPDDFAVRICHILENVPEKNKPQVEKIISDLVDLSCKNK